MKKISLLASLSCFLSAVLAGAAERPAPNAAQMKRIRILDAPVSGPWKLVANRGTHPVDVKSDFYAADPELVNLVRSATTDSGETDTTKWMTAMINCRQID